MRACFKIFFSAIILSCTMLQSKAQNFNLWRDYLESLEVQPASARASAMGYAQVANGGTIAEARINPAGLGLMPQKLQTEFGHSSPVFVDAKAQAFFSGAGYKINSKLTVGLSRFGYSVKNPVFGIMSSNHPTLYFSKHNETWYTGTISYEALPGLHVGVNLNYFDYYLKGRTQGVSRIGSFVGDAGILYEKKLDKARSSKILERSFHAGVSFTNLNMAKTKWELPIDTADVTITSHLYGGAAYFSSFDLKNLVYGKSKLIGENDRTVDICFQVQYINFVNMALTNEKAEHSKQPIKWGRQCRCRDFITQGFCPAVRIPV